MLVVVIADTHIPRRARGLPEALRPHLNRAEAILHAGDLMEPRLLEELAGYAPTHAVRGNLDSPESGLPETLEVELDGLPVAMVHDSGRKDGRHRRMARRFPESRVVVFGHSHIPLLEDKGGLMLLNPGSPTDKRRQPDYTFAELEVSDGEVSASIHKL